MTRRAAGAALALFAPACGWGQAAAPAEPQRIEIKGGTDSDTEQRRREPVAKSIVGREELDKHGDVSVTDVLKRQPGVNLSGGNPRLRGLGAGYTLILVNGEPAPPGFSLDNLPPSQVERIEITKGPTAEHSTQAVAGTINIILRATPKQRQRELNLRAGWQAYKPMAGVHAMWADRVGDLSFSLPVSAFQWAGDADWRNARTTRDTAGAPQQLDVRGHDRWWGGGVNTGPRLNWKLGERGTLEWQTFAHRNEYNTDGRSLTEVLAGSTPTSVDDSYTVRGRWQQLRTGLNWVQRYEEGARLEARAGVQGSGGNNRIASLGLDGQGRQTIERNTWNENSEQARTTAGKFTLPVGEAHTLAAGWDLEFKQRREVKAVFENGLPLLGDLEAEPFHARLRRQAGYVQDEWAISPQWSTYLGLRVESIAVRSASRVDDLRSRSEVVSPLVHLNYRPDPKARDLVRASVTRAYKAPELSLLLARPSLNTSYPADTPNPENGPDRVGNPGLQPELSTNFDLAFERYFAGNGVLSVGVFHRRVTGLVRNAVTLERPSWATVERWVSRPVNLAGARSTGFELEVKGPARDLMPAALGLPPELSLRAAFSRYRSSVEGIPGPDNRLEQQQPWQFSTGFDHRLAGLPLGLGASLALTPGYTTQQTPAQTQFTGRVRNLDAYASWTFSREAVARLSLNNLSPLPTQGSSQTVEAGGYVLSTLNERQNRTSVNLSLNLKL